MANLHSRSNSLPSKSHPSTHEVQEKLCRLKSSADTSTSASSNLASLTDLHEGINNLIRVPSIQHALSNKQGQNRINELLEGSLELVDLCGFCRDMVCLTKQSVQELESSIRRSRGETATADDICTYVASRKKIDKMMNKYVKNLNKNTRPLHQEYDEINPIITILREADSLGFSVLKSSLMILSGVKERSNQKSRSFISKFTQIKRAYSDIEQNIQKLRKNAESSAMKDMLKQLISSEMVIEEVEERLESSYRSLVKTRVSLLRGCLVGGFRNEVMESFRNPPFGRRVWVWGNGNEFQIFGYKQNPSKARVSFHSRFPFGRMESPFDQIMSLRPNSLYIDRITALIRPNGFSIRSNGIFLSQ